MRPGRVELSAFSTQARSKHRQHAFDFSPAGKRILSRGTDKTVRVWNTDRGVERATLIAHDNAVYCRAWSPDGGRFASAGKNGTVKIWDADSMRPVALKGHKDDISVCAFNPAAGRIVTGSGDRSLRVWDTYSGCMQLKLCSRGPGIADCTFTADAMQVVSASDDRRWAS